MNAKSLPEKEPEKIELENKMFRLPPNLVRAFDVLKGEQGPRSGTRLIEEAIVLLLEKYGKDTSGLPKPPAPKS